MLESRPRWSLGIGAALLLVCLATVLATRFDALALGSSSLDGDSAARAEFTYPGPDGAEHVYLGGHDSYSWLRMARNRLRTGGDCDVILHGECLDRLANAPHGAPMAYAGSPHTRLLATYHRLATRLNPGIPLPASAQQASILLGLLTCLCAFLLGARLAGPLAGAVAGVLIPLHPLVLERSTAADNDVWNLLLPLALTLCVVLALDASRPRGRVGWALAGGVLTGVHAGVWRGWVLAFGATALALGVYVLVETLHRGRAARIAGDPASRRPSPPVVVLGIFLCAATVSVGIAGPGFSVDGLAQQVRSMLRLDPEADATSLPDDARLVPLPPPPLAAAAPDLAPASATAPELRDPLGEPSTPVTATPRAGADSKDGWPSALRTVAELREPGARRALDAMHGRMRLLIGILGVLLLLLPARGWQDRHVAAFLAGAVLIELGLIRIVSEQSVTTLLVGLGLALPVVTHRGGASRPATERFFGAGLILAFWLLSALQVSYGGVRYHLLLVAPWGLGTGVFAARAVAAVGRFAWEKKSWAGPIAVVIGILVVAGSLRLPLRQARAVALEQRPAMNDAWWDTLDEIRRRTPPETIVNAWWDHGHWIKYGAERRVVADGSTLQTHVHHWLARALSSANERETLGLLRMLDCGSDVRGRTSGEPGAMELLLASGRPLDVAYGIVADLALLDRSAARAALARQQVGGELKDRVLAATHCTPPPALLVLSSDLFQRSGWLRLAAWDPRRDRIARWVRERTRSAAIAAARQRWGWPQERAEGLVDAARSAVDPASFARPSPGRLESDWIACERGETGELVCPLDRTGVGPGLTAPARSRRPAPTGPRVFTYRPDAPGESRVRFAVPTPGPEPVSLRDETPETLLVVTPTGLAEVSMADPTLPGWAVLVDPRRARVMAGASSLLTASIVRLLQLEARGTEGFELFEMRRSEATGERVAAFRIRWPR